METGIDFNPHPMYQDSFGDPYSQEFSEMSDFFHELSNFPKNTLSKEEKQNWEKAKKIKEAFIRLKDNPDFQLYRQVCYRKWVYDPYTKPDLSFSEEGQKRAWIRYHQQLVIMQLNSDFNHYVNLTPPPVEVVEGKEATEKDDSEAI